MTRAATERVGVDTGGTFTDLVASDGRVVKLLSTPADPSAAVAAAIEAVDGAGVLSHGTTVATNALLERRGSRVALVATEGHADVIEIARQVRPSLYDQWADRPFPLVPRSGRVEVAGRLDAAGHQLAPVGAAVLPPGVDAVAVCLLHSDRNPAHERTVGAALRSEGFDVTCSHELSPEFREYERAVTTVVNAYLRRVCAPYLGRLAGLADEVLVMTSAGGLVGVEEAVQRPAALLVSGPAGGVLAGSQAAAAAGFPDAVTFDMGGTSTDVCLVQAGRPEGAAQRTVAGLPVRLPALDVHTIGAGGGSIAGIDPGGALVVGPASAGADPGPACYGRGGLLPTVTDADLCTGRIPSEGCLSGLERLDAGAAATALERAGASAEGVIAVVDANMVRALRRVSVERGVDARHVALIAFGGAGPLHACALADALGMPAVVVPPRAGVLSATGLLGAPRQVDLVRSWAEPSNHPGAVQAAASLAVEARRDLDRHAGAGNGPDDAGTGVSVSFDCRYAGQSHELTVASIDEFEAEHRRRNGFALEGSPVEVVAVRAVARRASPVDTARLADPGDRHGVHRGPAVIAEADCTIWVAPGWTAAVGGGGSWVLTR